MASMPAHSVEGMLGRSQRVALTRTTFLAYVLPPLVCLYSMGVLVQLKGTRFYRLAFLPVVVWFAWRGSFVDMSGGDRKQGQMNTGLIIQMMGVTMRATIWAFVQEPFRRQSPSNKHEHNESDSESVYTALWNAGDLMWNTRGVGWNWQQELRLVIPKPVFETDSRIVFVLLSAARLALYGLGVDACIQTVRMLSPDTFGSLNGGSLFDHTLPFHLELLRAVFACFLVVWMNYFAIEWSHQLLAIVGTILFQQRPSQWPPLFDSPWLSTSLTEFWGRRWHQMLRELVIGLGSRPSGYLFGRLGGILGAFLVSGIFHDIELRAFGGGGNSVALVGFWVMSGVGVVLERVWTKTTGRRVGGVGGRMWTFGWLALWGVWMVNEWAKSGRLGALGLPGDFEPSVALLGFVRRCLIG